MHLRKILSGTLALLLVAGAAHAFETVGGGAPASSGASFNLPGVALPGAPRGDARSEGSVRYAQAGDPRITQLEERIRTLSGTIEELNFQVLQMQEQMRKMQEDNEFRFQELEQGRSNATGTRRQGGVGPAPASTPARPADPAKRTDAERSGSVEEIIVQDQSSGGTAAPSGAAPDANRGAAPQILGNVRFDANGNVVGGTENPNAPRASVPAARQGTDNTVVAALPSTDDPEEIYRNSYEFILSGDYGTAETGFKDHIARFPKDAKTADARFWLGEAQLGQKHYRDAAETFLAANKEFPTSKKAPDMLLKLGVSLVGLNQKDVACATFAEVGKRYPSASGVLKERVKQEQAIAAC